MLKNVVCVREGERHSTSLVTPCTFQFHGLTEKLVNYARQRAANLGSEMHGASLRSIILRSMKIGEECQQLKYSPQSDLLENSIIDG